MRIDFGDGFGANAAFADGLFEAEAARILRKVADEVEAGKDCGVMHDVNGNRVGEWSL